MRVYSDTSFAKNPDGTSQLGNLILLADAKNDCIILSYRSYKCRRSVCSALAAETIAFVDTLYNAFLLSVRFRLIFVRKLPMRMLTESRSLYEVMIRGSPQY